MIKQVCCVVGLVIGVAGCWESDWADPWDQGGGGSGGGGGGGEGECQPPPTPGCKSESDCVTLDPEKYAACYGVRACLLDEYGIGHCTYLFPHGMITPLQDVVGDCATYVCDDADVIIAFNSADPEDDHDDCTVDWCISPHKTGHSYAAGSMTTQGKPCVGTMGPGVCDLGECIPQ